MKGEANSVKALWYAPDDGLNVEHLVRADILAKDQLQVNRGFYT